MQRAAGRPSGRARLPSFAEIKIRDDKVASGAAGDDREEQQHGLVVGERAGAAAGEKIKGVQQAGESARD
jgi:hypothetical protein